MSPVRPHGSGVSRVVTPRLKRFGIVPRQPGANALYHAVLGLILNLEVAAQPFPTVLLHGVPQFADIILGSACDVEPCLALFSFGSSWRRPCTKLPAPETAQELGAQQARTSIPSRI